MILLTTSREPTANMRSFCKELANSLSGVQRLTRGKTGLSSIVKKAYELEKHWVILVERWKGGPGKIRFIEAKPEGPRWVDPTLFIRGIRLRRDQGMGRTKWSPAGGILFDSSNHPCCVLASLMASITGLRPSPIGSLAQSKTALMITRCQGCSAKMTIVRTDSFAELGPTIYIDRLHYSKKSESLRFVEES